MCNSHIGDIHCDKITNWKWEQFKKSELQVQVRHFDFKYMKSLWNFQFSSLKMFAEFLGGGIPKGSKEGETR